MANFNGNRPNSFHNGDRKWDNNKSSTQQKQAVAGPFPDDYVEFADKLMEKKVSLITTSKLRNFLSLFMDIYNTEILRTDDTLLDESVVKLQLARIRIAYECGRDSKMITEFVEAANLLPWLKDIGTSREKAIRYIHYLEALVAYHRFHGGRKN